MRVVQDDHGDFPASLSLVQNVCDTYPFQFLPVAFIPYCDAYDQCRAGTQRLDVSYTQFAPTEFSGPEAFHGGSENGCQCSERGRRDYSLGTNEQRGLVEVRQERLNV